MNDPASLLLRLLDCTDAVLRPGMVLGRRPEIAKLRADVASEAGRPQEFRAVGDEAVMLAQVLELIEAAREANDDSKVQRFCQVAGVLAPCVRGDYGVAIERRRNMVPRADPPDYVPRRAAGLPASRND